MGTKSIKAFLLLGLFFLIGSQSFGQVLKFNTLEATKCRALEDGSWSEWTEAVEVMQAVVVNFDNATITVASSPKQKYDILEAEEQSKDEDGDDFFPFICTDDQENPCRVLLSVLHSEGGRPLLTIEYDDLIVIYSMTYAE